MPKGEERKHVLSVTRNELRKLRPVIEEAIRREDYEGYMELLTSRLGVERGSEQCRFFEAKFWQAVAELRKSKMQRP